MPKSGRWDISTGNRSAAKEEPLARRLVTARIWNLLISLRLSADIVYRREVGIAELDRRLLITAHTTGGATPLALNTALGHDKAQISRALKRLESAGHITRNGLRGPVSLTRKGQRLTSKMLEIATRRNETLTQGVDPDRLTAFCDMVERLTNRAIKLLAQEKALGGDADSGPAPPKVVAPVLDGAGKRLLAAELMTLLIYLQRSATLSYKRLTGLSGFDWQVLSQVAEHRPLPLAQLILILGRDKGQAGRTVKRLEDLGLIERCRAPGKRAVQLEPTARGLDVYADMVEDALRRNDFLTAGTGRGAMKQFLATLDALTESARRMFENAKALPLATSSRLTRSRGGSA